MPEGMIATTKEELEQLALLRQRQELEIAMNRINTEMREIPVHPSEKPKDIQRLLHVDLPVDGGPLTFIEGKAHPYRGFPVAEVVEKIDTLKKVQRAALSGLYHALRDRPWYQKALLALVPWVFKDLFHAYLNALYRPIERIRIKSYRYSPAIRELHRVMSMKFANDTAQGRDIRDMVRDIACMFMEFDNAYRYRFQDIAAEIDKEAARKNPSKEVTRLLDLLIEREQTQEIKDTWTLVKTFLPLYLTFNRSARRDLTNILVNLDISKVALDDADKCFTDDRKDYKFAYMLCQLTTSTSKRDTQRSPSPASSQVQEPTQSGFQKQDTVSS